MNMLFLIPLWSDSSGLPGKNPARVNGIPMVGRTARVACLAAWRRGRVLRKLLDEPEWADAWARRSAGAGGGVTNTLRSGRSSRNSFPASSVPDNVRH
jgi:hypothetical protein